jgi:myo-inositol 2-dehydrogenase/D-chiro-inositol 1-dehydrogenase
MNASNRRHFLLGSLAAAATLPSYGQDMIGVGMIGTGNRGSYLLKGVLAQTGVKVVALCDLKPDRLDAAATSAARDKPVTFTDYRRLLENKNVNAVFIATPCDLHVEMAIAALQAGKHVYCEKPVGITPESIGRLVKVAKAARTVFQVGQQRRSEVRLAKIIEQIHQGAAGKVIMLKAQRHASDDLNHNGPSADWFFNASRSGDVIVEMSVHNLDVCNWIIDSRPERAAGFGGTLLWVNDPPGRTNMDGYSLTYDYPNGVKLSYTQVFFHPRGMPNGGQYTYVYGTEGGVDLDSSMYYPRVASPRSRPKTLVEPQEEDRNAHIAAFFDCIRTGKKPPADIIIGATGALTAILGREAIYRKKVMTWQDLGVDL